MKTFRIKIIGIFMLMAILGLNSCIKDDFEKPPFTEPHFTMAVGDTLLTIADLKANVVSGSAVISHNWYIKGIVVSSDQAGNYYKDLVIQDSTGGLDIRLENGYLYNNYPIGQLIYVKCNGLYLSNANGSYNLGYKGEAGLVTIPEILIKSYLFRDKFPGPEPTPDTLTSVTLTDQYINKLVVFNNISFADAGSVYADPLNLLGGMTPRNFSDNMSATPIILRSSTYANFKNSILPLGSGSIKGILTRYNTSWQFMIREVDDVYGFPVGLKIILRESFATAIGSFMQYSVEGPQFWVNDPQYACMKMSGYEGGNYIANEDWLISPKLDLSSYTNTILNFQSAMKYGTAGDGTLKVFYSTDYDGVGNPNDASWTEFPSYNLSTGNFTFTPSGDIDLSAIGGSKVYIGFKYQCGTTGVPTWEVKNVIVKGQQSKK